MMTIRKYNYQAAIGALLKGLLNQAKCVAPDAIVNNFAIQPSPRTPLHGSASVFGRRGARAREHAARPPARFSLLSSINQTTKNKSCALRAHQEKSTKFISGLDQE